MILPTYNSTGSELGCIIGLGCIHAASCPQGHARKDTGRPEQHGRAWYKNDTGTTGHHHSRTPGPKGTNSPKTRLALGFAKPTVVPSSG